MTARADLLGLLVDGGWLTAGAATQIRREARGEQVAPVRRLLELGTVKDDVILGILRDALGLAEVDPLTPAALDLDALRWLQRDTAEAHLVLPLSIDSDRPEPVLRLAMADPLDRESVQTVEREAGFLVEPMLARADAIRRAIARHYGRVRTQVISRREAEPPKRWVDRAPELETEPLHRLEDEATPAQLVQALIRLLEKRGLLHRDELVQEIRALLEGEEIE